MRRSSRPVLTAALLAAACSQASAVDQTPRPKATRDLLQVYPGAHIHTEQGRVRILYGTPMGGGITAQACKRPLARAVGVRHGLQSGKCF